SGCNLVGGDRGWSFLPQRTFLALGRHGTPARAAAQQETGDFAFPRNSRGTSVKSSREPCRKRLSAERAEGGDRTARALVACCRHSGQHPNDLGCDAGSTLISAVIRHPVLRENDCGVAYPDGQKDSIARGLRC